MYMHRLIGKVITKIDGLNIGSECITFYTTDGKSYTMLHQQDCCETVQVCEISGDIENLIGFKILKAEESSNEDRSGNYESATWTFYKFATIKGWLDIRWLGTSNGYYSESVDFFEVKP